jgi:hypothetical protein
MIGGNRVSGDITMKQGNEGTDDDDYDLVRGGTVRGRDTLPVISGGVCKQIHTLHYLVDNIVQVRPPSSLLARVYKCYLKVPQTE